MLAATLVATTVVGLLFIIFSLCSKESAHSPTHPTPYECGFEAFSTSRVSFSLKFYTIVVVFLVFDVEIVLVLPTCLAKSCTPHNTWLGLIVLLFVVLILGLLYEWATGSLEWSKWSIGSVVH